MNAFRESDEPDTILTTGPGQLARLIVTLRSPHRKSMLVTCSLAYSSM
ncbi:hypothetical protein [Streptomyces sp. NPDC002088]